jgi:hypothetical protein
MPPRINFDPEFKLHGRVKEMMEHPKWKTAHFLIDLCSTRGGGYKDTLKVWFPIDSYPQGVEVGYSVVLFCTTKKGIVRMELPA